RFGALCIELLHTKAVNVGARAQRGVDAVRNLVVGGDRSDQTITIVGLWILLHDPVRVVVVAVVPVELAVGRTTVGGATFPEVAQRLGVDLPAEPVEHRLEWIAARVSDARAVTTGVVDVLNGAVAGQARIRAEGAAE